MAYSYSSIFVINSPVIEELDAWADAMTVADGDNYSRLGIIPWLDSGDDAFVLPGLLFTALWTVIVTPDNFLKCAIRP